MSAKTLACLQKKPNDPPHTKVCTYCPLRRQAPAGFKTKPFSKQTQSPLVDNLCNNERTVETFNNPELEKKRVLSYLNSMYPVQ
jgi:hypothetical protein